jgi:GGDEF domain-containing protein
VPHTAVTRQTVIVPIPIALISLSLFLQIQKTIFRHDQTPNRTEIEISGTTDRNHRKIEYDCVVVIKRLEMLQLKLESKLESKIDWEAIAHTDEMTQLPNRRALDRHLASLTELEKQVSIAIIDFDFFKEINDTQGHLSGDEALKSVARLLLDTVRDLDNETAIACRFGGDEFVFVADIDPLLVGILSAL